MKKIIPPYNVINWDINHDKVEFYDIMPYLVSCWKEEKKRKHKIWNLSFTDSSKNIDDTRMPETFDEFKKFVDDNAHYQFWARCEYEVVISDWPCKKCEEKIDVYAQVKANLDVVTKHFMDYILGK